jgi:hypothetical protein
VCGGRNVRLPHHYLGRGLIVRKVITEFVCDTCGSQDHVETTALSFEGVDYEVDLCVRDFNQLDALLAPLLGQSRRVGGRLRRRVLPTVAAAVSVSRPALDDDELARKRHAQAKAEEKAAESVTVVPGVTVKGRRATVADIKAKVTELAPAGATRAKLVKSWWQLQSNDFKKANPVPSKGRIPNAIIAAYEKAQTKQPTFKEAAST